MSKELDILKCELCGQIIEVVRNGAGKLECCGQAMTVCEKNTVDAAIEKHIPEVKKIDGGYSVTVGSVEHPMTEAHFIEFIELVCENEVIRVALKPNDVPKTTFKTTNKVIEIRAYCNLHGLWAQKI